MPDPDLVCEVRCEGGTYRDWLGVSVSQDYGDAWMRKFRLVCAEPSSKGLLRLKPEDRVDIALAGRVVIQKGYIETRQAGFDASRHVVQIEGYSKAGLTVEGSVVTGTGQYRGYRLDSIARDVLKPLGLKFRVENGPQGWDFPFPQVMVRKGESHFAMIARLCTQRGLWVRAEPNGDLVAGPKDAGVAVRFEEGKNILAANCTIKNIRIAELVSNSQQPGSDSLFGRNVSEVQATAPIPSAKDQLKKIILNEMPASTRELNLRTNMSAQALAASSFVVAITYPGWLKPDGTLWNLTDAVTVKSPMLFPTETGQMDDLMVWSYTYSQDGQGGTQTTVELVNRLAAGQRGRALDALEDDGFFSAPAPSSAEALT